MKSDQWNCTKQYIYIFDEKNNRETSRHVSRGMGDSYDDTFEWHHWKWKWNERHKSYRFVEIVSIWCEKKVSRKKNAISFKYFWKLPITGRRTSQIEGRNGGKKKQQISQNSYVVRISRFICIKTTNQRRQRMKHGNADEEKRRKVNRSKRKCGGACAWTCGRMGEL